MTVFKGHEISVVQENSIAWEEGVEPGMFLVSVNGTPVEDVFDYRFLMNDEHVDVLIREANGDETLLEIDKEADEDFGVEFVSSMMDDYKSCHNRCIFCFIDQMPPGMRDTLYFKDDDSRLSFLQGNYVTLTNMNDRDINRIIRYRMEPINISVQTTNPELRVKMLRNRFAGDIFPKLKKLKDAGIAMNGQIVLCKGWNDGAELDRTISDLTEYLPEMRSVSVVPVGLSRFRDGLEKLEPFTKEDAEQVIDMIEGWQKRIWEKLAASYVPEEDETEPDLMRGAPRHFIHASDEWYILAGRELPPAEQYDGFIQYENGVGMLRLLQMETDEALAKYRKEQTLTEKTQQRRVTSVCGLLAAPYIRRIMEQIEAAFPWVKVDVCPIRNRFFGESITVTGLITGQDLISQLQERRENGIDLGEELLLPVSTLRAGERVLLDDICIDDIERSLGIPVRVVWDSGEDTVRAALGLPPVRKEERQIYE
ncbi:MAG: DUF512 domain-containing protein [Lachnospiraceae bacterium]|nr:DUF512 domain-containing protein [Lachnospiraceae bacterium]